MSLMKKRVILALLIGFAFGVVWLVAVRFALYEKKEVHYHANFAVYINGEKEMFDSFAFYEEVQACGADEAFNPRIRTHMHDSVNHVVHVHDEGATWGHLFANLGFVLGDDLIDTDKNLYVENESNKMTFTLNGKEVSTVTNQTIRSEDVLLINFGNDSDQTLQERYDGITKDAADYNQRQDPSSCSGGKPASFNERLKAAIVFPN